MAAQFRNALLNALSPSDRELVSSQLEHVALASGHVLIEPHRPIPHVHFIERGLALVTSHPGTKNETEVGMIGHDGMSGLPVILGGSESPFGVFVQKAGTAHRIPIDQLLAAFAASRTLHAFMLNYAQVFFTQTAEAARANAHFTIETRVARWLLMAHDRTDEDEIEVTHELLARMLAVRRPGVTIATHVLEGNKLIKSLRRRIRVIDRAGLEAFAGSSYGLPEAEHQRLIA